MPTIRDVTYDLLRELGLTTMFGNPGSTEENFLKNFPSDFTYILALQEASVMGMADGYAQATGRPAIINVHTAAGFGNAMGNLMTAFLNKTPIIVTAGQQAREMLLLEPFLTNVEATMLPRPWVKWSYEPGRAEDVPAAFMRAFATALQPPAGPVFLSLPLDDWDKPARGAAVVRTVSTRVAPDPTRVRSFADIFSKSRSPVLVFGSGIVRSGGWDAAIKFAETVRAPVWAAPACERTPFPEDHPLYQGFLPFAIGPLAEKLKGHDLVLVIGAPVFRYYPYLAGEYVPTGTRLLQVTDDPQEAARAPVGESLLGDALLTLVALTELLPQSSRQMPQPRPRQAVPPPTAPGRLTAAEVFFELSEVKPENAVLVEESPSNVAELHRWWPITRPDSFFTFASGGLGWNLPASVGIALGERATGRNRPVIVVIGDGAFQYSVQSLWTAAQQKLPILFVVLCNGEYCILKSFAALQGTPGVPGLDIPNLDIVSLGRGYGCKAQRATTRVEIGEALKAALQSEGPTVLEIPISPEVPPLI